MGWRRWRWAPGSPTEVASFVGFGQHDCSACHCQYRGGVFHGEDVVSVNGDDDVECSSFSIQCVGYVGCSVEAETMTSPHLDHKC